MSDPLATLAQALHDEQENIGTLVEQVSGNTEAVKLVIDGLTFPVETYRYNCNRVIVEIARAVPAEVYPYWDRIAELLASSNTYHRCSAINILPHLIPADRGSKFEGIFDRLFARLDDESVIPPCYLARNCPVVAGHRPELIQRIVERLLSIDATHHEEGRKDLIKADIILALDRMFEGLENKAEVIGFVEAQLNCSSPKARKAAKAFLKQHGPK
jgi:hypothetical protein